jgi:hypothetical protein
MAAREEVGDHTIRVPEHMIETINRLVRTSRQMLTRPAASRPLRNLPKNWQCRSKRWAKS